MTGCDASVWDISDMTYMAGFFSWCDMNSDLGSWDVSNVTDMSYMFSNASFDNGGSPSISGWDTSSVTRMDSMFSYHYSFASTGFNQPIGSWDVSNVSNFYAMFNYNAWFDQDLGSWDVTSATYMNDFMRAVTLSTANYNSLLQGWAPQSVNNGINIHFGNSTYSAGSAASARSTLVSKGWTITDGGQA